MALYKDHITLSMPSTIYVVGKSNEGKSFFINDLVDNLPKKYKIVYIVNAKFETEPELLELAHKNKKIYIIRATNLGSSTLEFLQRSMTSKDPKLLIFDNFTYAMTPGLLDFFTYSRKWNASSVFIGHTLYADKNLSPRIRESINYVVFFYLPISKTYKQFLGEELFNEYVENIHHKSYKFMIYDIGNSEYSIGKLPEYSLKVVNKDQFTGKEQKRGREIAKQLEELKQIDTLD